MLRRYAGRSDGTHRAHLGEEFGAAAKSAAANTDVIQARSGAWMMQQQFNTFIPGQYAETPFGLQPCFEAYMGTGGVGYFGGDNRGFASSTDDLPSVRTGLSINRSFDAGGLHTSTFRDKRTSGTVLYNTSGQALAWADADLSNMQRIGDSGGETGSGERWSHSVSDPLCSIAPTIDYTVNLTGWSGGEYSIFGDHDQAPSYEFRVKGVGVWDNPYKFINRGLEYLAPGAPPAHVEVSGRII